MVCQADDTDTAEDQNNNQAGSTNIGLLTFVKNRMKQRPRQRNDLLISLRKYLNEPLENEQCNPIKFRSTKSGEFSNIAKII